MLSVTPRVAMFDSPVMITVKGLQPGQKVTVAAHVTHVSGKFESFAYFKADNHGCIDSRINSSEGGTYEGVHQMGLFTTLQQSPDQRPGLRLMPRSVAQPLQYRFSLYNGHGVHESAVTIDTVLVDRHFLHPAVDRREVEVGRLRGTLFIPKCKADHEKLPGIIDIFGTGGGLMEHRGALLASKGFAVLCLAYFNFKDLPVDLDSVDLNYFEEAINWLTRQPNVTEHIGLIGTSLGSMIAVMCGIRFPKLKAVVGVNGFYTLTTITPLTWNGVPLPTVEFGGDFDEVQNTDIGAVYNTFMENMEVPEELIFHIENCPPETKWLIISATDDLDMCSVKSAKILEKRMMNAGKSDRMTVLILEDAGHLLEPPFMPHCLFSYNRIYDQNLAWGGNKYAHADGQEKMWSSIIDFFSANIAAPKKVPDFDSFTSLKSSL